MKLPRDLSGDELARALKRFGYEVTRQSGSHMRLSSGFKGTQHHITIPAHAPLKVGTLSQILSDVAGYLELTRDQLAEKLFS
ncbi:MAG TPA: type II toxin-antitoxin system HicA family toxin [Candidatus Baltobacteraceae bacterium]|nr:type II toxin-antitoxin system HicA family toxin [Candidatus Baltobacteraceae bacterium]